MTSPMKRESFKRITKLLFLGYGAFWELKLVCPIPIHARVTVQVLEKSNNGLCNITSEVDFINPRT